MRKHLPNVILTGSVRPIKVCRNNELLPTNTFVLSFNVSTLPTSIKVGYLNIPVEPFIPNPLRCFNANTLAIY